MSQHTRQHFRIVHSSRGINPMIRDQVKDTSREANSTVRNQASNSSPKVNTEIRDQARNVAAQRPGPAAA